MGWDFKGKRALLPVLLWSFTVAAVCQSPDPNPAAKSDPATSRSRPIRANVDIVLVNVTVVDAESDRPVTGLTKDNFQIYEDKQLQRVDHFSTEDVPISAAVIFDASGSMTDKIDKSRQALSQFFRGSNPNDEFSLIAFGDRPEALSTFTREAGTLQDKVNFIEPKGKTALIDAIYLGIDQMRHARNPRKILLVISDGGDNHSRYNASDLRKIVKEADVQIYSIGIYEPSGSRSTPEEISGPALLAEVSGMTGGRGFTVENIDDLPAIATKISREIRNLYVLGFSPGSSKRDGKWHKIQVKLRLPNGVPTLRLFSRSGYYAAESIEGLTAAHH